MYCCRSFHRGFYGHCKGDNRCGQKAIMDCPEVIAAGEMGVWAIGSGALVLCGAAVVSLVIQAMEDESQLK